MSQEALYCRAEEVFVEGGKFRDQIIESAKELSAMAGEETGFTGLYPRTNLMVGARWEIEPNTSIRVELVGINRSLAEKYRKNENFRDITHLSEGFVIASASTNCRDVQIFNPDLLRSISKGSPRECAASLIEYVVAKTESRFTYEAKEDERKPVWER